MEHQNSELNVNVVETSTPGMKTKIILFNDNYHTFEQVVNQLQMATKCSEEMGFYYAYTVHTKGQSIVYEDDIDKCVSVNELLRKINLKTRIVA